MEAPVRSLINTWPATVHQDLLEQDAKQLPLSFPKSIKNSQSTKIIRIFTFNPLKLITTKSLLKYVYLKKMSLN